MWRFSLKCLNCNDEGATTFRGIATCPECKYKWKIPRNFRTNEMEVPRETIVKPTEQEPTISKMETVEISKKTGKKKRVYKKRKKKSTTKE